MRLRPEMLAYMRVARMTPRGALIRDRASGMMIWCRVCLHLSSNEQDVKNEYCGRCHVFHRDAPAPEAGKNGSRGKEPTGSVPPPAA